MAVFIALTTDGFTNTFNSAVGNNANTGVTGRAGSPSARRPLRGLEVKDDTYAILKVVQANGKPILLLDSGSADGWSPQTTNFILQSVKEARMEKHQIVETFGDPYIFFFGESPRFLDVSAILVNSNDFNWLAEFWSNYDNYLRGTKLVEQGARTYLFYDDNIVEGYMLMAEASQVAEQPLSAQLSFRLYVTNTNNVNFVGNPKYPVRSTVSIPAGVTDGNATLAAYSNEAVDAQYTAESLAQVSAQQMSSGFGGGSGLVASLQAGISFTGTLSTDSLLQDASDATGQSSGDQTRTMPLRGNIADNSDEWTGPDPSPIPTWMNPSNDPNDDYSEFDIAGQPDVLDLFLEAVQQIGAYGGDINDPDSFGDIGFGVSFSAGVGFGLNSGYGTSASYGPAAGSGFGAGYYGGINGGLGFTGQLTPSPVLATNQGVAVVTVTPTSSGVSYLDGVYGNGVPVQGGVIQGTGVGGGIPGGMSGGIGPNGPGTLQQFQGGTSYSSGNGFSVSLGYGDGVAACGASINVGGAPSSFSLVATAGTYNPTPPDTISFYVGDDGSISSTNTTGVSV